MASRELQHGLPLEGLQIKREREIESFEGLKAEGPLKPQKVILPKNSGIENPGAIVAIDISIGE